MGAAKDLHQQLYEARLDELLSQGVPEPQAEASAERYANRALPDRLADEDDHADFLRRQRRDDSITGSW